MWSLITDDAKTIRESEILWPELPVNTRIASLSFRTRQGHDHKIQGHEAYGFQRYQVTRPCGLVVGSGAQLIGILGDWATITDIDDVMGTVRTKSIPRTELTYSPELLRHG